MFTVTLDKLPKAVTKALDRAKNGKTDRHLAAEDGQSETSLKNAEALRVLGLPDCAYILWLVDLPEVTVVSSWGDWAWAFTGFACSPSRKDLNIYLRSNLEIHLASDTWAEGLNPSSATGVVLVKGVDFGLPGQLFIAFNGREPVAILDSLDKAREYRSKQYETVKVYSYWVATIPGERTDLTENGEIQYD